MSTKMITKAGVRFICQHHARQPERCTKNVVTALSTGEWSDGVFFYDEFRQAIVLHRQPPCIPEERPSPGSIEAIYPREWCHTDSVRTISFLSTVYDLHVTESRIMEAVEAISRSNSHHRLKEWLEGLVWDNTVRVENMFIDYMGAPASEYVRGITKCWMISAVARVMRPGCQADYMPVLIGPGGLGKSQFTRVLFGEEWSSDTTIDISNKDGILLLRGKWCIGLDEMSVLSKGQIEAVKNFLTRTKDSVRKPYSRFTEDVLRQNVFIGSTNEEKVLIDQTGNRRFWPVEVGELNREGLLRAREGLWAESLHLWRTGEPWWPSKPLEALCAEAQAKHTQELPWEEEILCWLTAYSERFDKSGGVTMSEVMRECVGKEMGGWVAADCRQVATILRKLGYYRRYTTSKSGKRLWKYVKDASHLKIVK